MALGKVVRSTLSSQSAIQRTFIEIPNNPGTADLCQRPRIEGMNFTDQESRWQVLERAHTGHLPDSSLIGAPLDYPFRTVSHSQQTASDYKLEPYDILAQDCILTPVSLEGELNIPFSDSTPAPWPASYPQGFDLPSVSPEPNAQEAAKGIRREVSPNFFTKPFL
jgi:hypothetical protein